MPTPLASTSSTFHPSRTSRAFQYSDRHRICQPMHAAPRMNLFQRRPRVRRVLQRLLRQICTTSQPTVRWLQANGDEHSKCSGSEVRSSIMYSPPAAMLTAGLLSLLLSAGMLPTCCMTSHTMRQRITRSVMMQVQAQQKQAYFLACHWQQLLHPLQPINKCWTKSTSTRCMTHTPCVVQSHCVQRCMQQPVWLAG